MPLEPDNKTPSQKKGGWLRKIALWLGLGALLLLLVHRPLAHVGGRWIAILVAKSQHIDLDLRISGNLWSRLELRDVSIRADGKGPAPITRLDLDRLAVDYHLWKLLSADWSRVLGRVEIGRMDGVLPRPKSSAKKTARNSEPLADALRNRLGHSLFPIGQLSIGRVDLEVKDVVTIRGLHAEVGRERPGIFSWELIQIAGWEPFVAARAGIVANQSAIEVEKLPLFPGLTLSRLSVHGRTASSPRGSVEIFVDAGGGTAAFQIAPLVTSGALDLVADVKIVRLDEIAAMLHADLPAPTFVDYFRLIFTGVPENPGDASAGLDFAMHSEENPAFAAATLRGGAKLERGALTISECAASSAGVDVRLGGEVTIPHPDFDPAMLGGGVRWTISAPKTGTINVAGAPLLHGVVKGGGSLRFENGKARFLGDVEAEKLEHRDVRFDMAQIHLDAQRGLTKFGDIFAGLAATLSVDARGLTAKAVRMDSLALKADVDQNRVTLEKFSVATGENQITGSGRAELKPGGAGFTGTPEIDLQIAAPKLGQFDAAVNRAKFSGAASGKARLLWEGGVIKGSFHANAEDLRLGKAPIGRFQVDVKFADGAAVLDTLSLDLTGVGGVNANGRAGLAEPMQSHGELKVDLAHLEKLEPILDALGHPAKLRGALNVEWTGDSRISSNTHSGKLNITGKGLACNALVLDEVRAAAVYSQGRLETHELLIAAGKTRLGARLGWKNGRLDVSDLAVMIAGEEALKGQVSIPLTPTGSRGALPFNQPVTAQLTGKNLDLAQFIGSFGIAPPVSGTVSLDLAASGTLSKPDVTLVLEGRSLSSAKAAPLAPTDLDLKLGIASSRLTVTAVARQRDVRPINATASLPYDLEKWWKQPGLIREVPLELSVKMPASSLAILPKFVPSIARIDATAAINAEVRGTINKPVVNGEASFAIKSLRMTSEKVPLLSNFSSRLLLRREIVTLENTRGSIGGGSFNIEGTVKIAELKQPEFNLRIRSSKVLVYRDDSLTARADADLSLKGPLSLATAAGTIFVTQSRFYKNVDILPIPLPGRPVPKVRTVATPMRISFPEPPLRDWKFDIVIRTREDDSFLIRGDLATGAAALDLRLSGTGLNPTLSGKVDIENFTATLPASKLSVQSGYVTFSPEDPFQPQLNIQAESRIGSNTIKAFISGPASAPRLDLSSEPPLSQGDIVSLLATGTTAGEVGRNPGTLATKAALAKVKQWFRKAFGRRGASGSQEESFMDRFELDVGAVDPKTGRPELNGRVRINDNLFLIGDIDMTGQFIGKMKYVIRFR